MGNYEDAQDLTQEAFVKAYRARGFDPGQPFLLVPPILRNTCFALRKRGRLGERSIHARASAQDDGDDTWEILDARAASPSDGAEARETKDVFAGALERLSARDREIIVLRHYQELSYKEIAAALSIPEGTVMSRLYHARSACAGCSRTRSTISSTRRNRRGRKHEVPRLTDDGPGSAAPRILGRARRGGQPGMSAKIDRGRLAPGTRARRRPTSSSPWPSPTAS